MSKNKGRKNNNRKTQEDGAPDPADPRQTSMVDEPETAAVPPAEPRKKLTVPERLLAKASITYETAHDVLQLATDRGAPADLIAYLQGFMVEADGFRGHVRELVESGWQPSAKLEMKELQVGDKVAVAADAKDKYAFIPEGTPLVANEIARSENGRIKSVLLKEELSAEVCEQQPEREERVFGWAQLSHLTRR